MREISGRRQLGHRRPPHRREIRHAAHHKKRWKRHNLLPKLLTISPNIRAIRDQVFHITEEITWTTEQFDEYWGYMDNFWVSNSTQPV